MFSAWVSDIEFSNFDMENLDNPTFWRTVVDSDFEGFELRRVDNVDEESDLNVNWDEVEHGFVGD